jgi:ketosteroid isomerase-like protein
MSANVDLIKGAYDSLAKGDVPAIMAMLDPDVQWTETEGGPYGGLFQGPQAVLDGVFMRLGTEWEGFTVTPHEFIDGGDDVVALVRYGGSYKDTGKPIDCEVAHVWTVRNGKATRFIQYADTAALQEAVTS